MFVDKVQVNVKAGDGGDGIVSFRHEIYVDKGGPDGGDGGKGGDVIAKATRNENTLAKYRFNKLLKADNGKNGGGQKKRGKSGQDLILDVPVGTVVIYNDEILADLTEDGAEAVIARGGDGGFGNAHFTSSVRQAPKVAEKGEKGEEFDFIFELKMIADIGLVGLPNAGKSTFLSVVSNARPEIADYPFTTLVPNLGVVDLDKDKSLLIADIPGLIEGASSGKGLGDEFLRHVSRCHILLHLIDSRSEDIVKDYKIIRTELEKHSPELATKHEVVALTKIDLIDSDIVEYQKELLEKNIQPDTPIYSISSSAHMFVKELLYDLYNIAQDTNKLEQDETREDGLPVISLISKSKDVAWVLTKKEKYWQIKGNKIEKFARRTDFDNPHGVARLRDIMKKMGILRELDRQGAEVGAEVRIGRPVVGKIEY
jgi:GTP-binding protein